MVELPFIDGFGYYSTADITRKWSAIQGGPVIQSAVVAHGPNALNCADDDQVHLVTPDTTSWVFGFRFRIDGFLRAALILQIRDDPTGTQVSLRVNQDQTLEVLRIISDSVSGGVSTFTLNANIWYFIEMKLTISNSIAADSCIVRVNEAPVITVDTGQDLQGTANSTANLIKLGSSDPISTQELYFETVYILGAGDFLGDSRIAQLFPNAIGSTNEFDGSDGNSVDNHLQVDEAITDDDTTYNESSTPGDIDLYNLTPMPTAAVIHMAQVNAVVRKDDAGSRTMRLVTRPASTNFFSPSKSPSDVSYSDERQLFDVSPETSLAWTKPELDGLQCGVEIET